MNELTVCLMTCGEETEQECMEKVRAWDGHFALQEVRNITPASAALNQMFSQCGTRFLVPLDADMILHWNALDRILEKIKGHSWDNDWHTILFPLWDTLTETKIYALKVFNMGAMRSIPYQDDPCPDIQHYKDMTAVGLRSIDCFEEEPIGCHVVRGNFFCYAKYRDLYLTARSRPRDLLESHFKGGRTLRERAINHAEFFHTKYESLGSQGIHYLYCMGGMLEGLAAPLTYKSKDLGNRKMKYESQIEAGTIIDDFQTWILNDKKHRVFA